MKSVVLITTTICLVIVSFAFRQNPVRYENLKVLPKNTNKQEMDSIMRHFSLSLGVRCTHCHVRGNDAQRNFNFASDENKNKNIARGMFKMMNRINRKYFKDKDDRDRVNRIPEVSCFSCHHGKEKPENRPPAPAQTPGQAPRTGAPAGTGG